MGIARKKNFALGYSYIFEAFLSWLNYGTLIATGISTIILFFSKKTGIAASQLYSFNTIGGYLSVAGVFVCSVLMKRTSIRFITTISYMITALGVFIIGRGQSLGAFIVFSAVTQFFYHGYCYGASNALIANWFPRKRGFIMGITTTGLMFSSFTVVMFMTKMTPVIGWTNVCNILAASILFLGIVSWFWIKDRPEDCGLLPDNMPITDEERESLKVSNIEVWKTKDILAHKDSILYMLGFGCLNMIGTGSLVMMVPFLMESGYSQVNAVWMMSIGGIAAIFGSLFLGWIDTWKGTKTATIILALVYVVGGAGTFFSGIIESSLLAVISIVSMSFVGGALANLGGSLVINMYGRSGFNQAWRYLNTGAQLLKAFCYAAIGIVTVMLGKYAFVGGVWGVVAILGLIFILLGKFDYRKPPANI